MYNYYGCITIETPNGKDFVDTIHVSTFELACMEIGALIKMFPSCAVLKCEVINLTDRTTIVISEMDEASKTCSYKFAKTEEYSKMYFALQKRWHNLYKAHAAYDDYLYSGAAFPELK